MKLEFTTLQQLDMVAFRFEVDGESIADVVYNNNISEAELRVHIATKYNAYPNVIEIAR